MTPAGIEPATFRFVAQHLNHCATADYYYYYHHHNLHHHYQTIFRYQRTKRYSYVNRHS